jgi:hypothetical protein
VSGIETAGLLPLPAGGLLPGVSEATAVEVLVVAMEVDVEGSMIVAESVTVNPFTEVLLLVNESEVVFVRLATEPSVFE